MSDYVYINDVEFVDSTSGMPEPYVYSLADEQIASTVGVYLSLEKAAEAIDRLVKDKNRSTKEFWGEILPLDRDLE